MYLQCPKPERNGHRLHTDICVAQRDGLGCEYLRREMIDLPNCQQEQYACDWEEAKKRGKPRGKGK